MIDVCCSTTVLIIFIIGVIVVGFLYFIYRLGTDTAKSFGKGFSDRRVRHEYYYQPPPQQYQYPYPQQQYQYPNQQPQPQSYSSMYCSKCGKQIPIDSNLCPYCGSEQHPK